MTKFYCWEGEYPGDLMDTTAIEAATASAAATAYARQYDDNQDYAIISVTSDDDEVHQYKCVYERVTNVSAFFVGTHPIVDVE